jgi:DNA-binding transcriptional ArsR family regulator
LKRSKHSLSRGRVLHQVAKTSPLSLKEIIRKAGYKYPTFYVHVKKADLAFEILAKYGKAMNHDFSNEFPEMADYILNDNGAGYKEQLSYEELLMDRDRWINKYQEQTERYQRLSDKYNKLLEEKLGLEG